MSNNIDAKYTNLGNLSYTGSQEDRELAYYRASGVTTTNLTDAENRFLNAAGFTSGSNEDRWKNYLLSLGYSGSVDDMLPLFWKNNAGSSITTSGLVSSFDAKNYSSGQTWSNSVVSPADSSAQTAYDYFLGATNGAEGSDPTITNTGTNTAYWGFDGGDFFTHSLAAGSMPAFLQTMHHASKKWTIEIWMQWNGTAGTQQRPIFDSGTSDQGGGDMSRGVMFCDLGDAVQTAGRLKFRVKQDSSGSGAWQRESDVSLPSGSVQMVAVSWDATGTDASFLYRNGNYESSSGDGTAGNTWTVTGATFGTLNVANSSRIGTRGDASFPIPANTRVYLVRLYNKNLTKAELDVNWNGTKSRYGL
jgi:hypothetical protein